MIHTAFRLFMDANLIDEVFDAVVNCLHNTVKHKGLSHAHYDVSVFAKLNYNCQFNQDLINLITSAGQENLIVNFPP